MLTGTKAPRSRRPAALAAMALTSIVALMLTGCAASPAAQALKIGGLHWNLGRYFS
jgi:hypothetical protein